MKAVIAGQAIVVSGNVKLADLEKIKKYAPEKLVLMGGEDGKEPIFGFGIAEGPGKIGKFGAEFSATPGRDGKATITLMIGEDVQAEDIKQYVADKIGPYIVLANELEAKIPAAVADIDSKMATIMDAIVIAG